VVCCAAAGLFNGVFYALVPVYLSALGQTVGAVALFMSAVSVAGLLVQLPAGLAADRLGRAGTAVALLALATVAAVAFVLAGGASWAVLVGIGAVFTASTAPLYGLGVGQLGDRLKPEESVAASGTLLLVWALAAAAGPVFAGQAIGLLGPSGLFVYLAAVGAMVGLFTGVQMLLGSAAAPPQTRT
jgi:MFS family permease